MEKETRIVIATFKQRITDKEIPYFRGCMIKESCNNPLFHNHTNESYNYTYPLIQYKTSDNNTLIVGINEGGEAIETLLKERISIPCTLGNHRTELELIGVRSQRIAINAQQSPLTYTIQGWLPLNSGNYRKFQETESLAERIKMLERILTANILSFAKGIGIYFTTAIHCCIQEISEEEPFTYKDIALKSFTVRFKTNILLPDYIGIGKSISIGRGIIMRNKDEKNR